MQKEKRKVIQNILNKMQNTSLSIIIAYIYITLPILIFVIGWCRITISIPVSIVIFISLVSAIVNTPAEWKVPWNKDNVMKLALALVIIFAWVLLSGIGQVTFQNWDQVARNGIYETLVHNNWPVTKEIMIGEMNQNRTLVYYIGFWMPSAIFGKIFGVSAGYVFQMFWSVLGIFSVYYFICARRKKIILWPLVIMIFFSGLDILAVALITPDSKLDFLWNLDHIEGWAGIYQYSSMTTQLFWVFNQALPCWVAVMLLTIQKNCKNFVFILSTVMLSATFPFIGMIPLVIYYIFYKAENNPLRILKSKEDQEHRFFTVMRKFVQELFSVQNVIGGGCIGILCFLYLKLNSSSTVKGIGVGRGVLEQIRGQAAILYSASIGTTREALEVGASVRPMWGIFALLYLMFIFLEFGIYMIFLYKREKNNFLYYLVFVLLCIIPFIRVGTAIDFCMRASLPALFLIMLMIIDYIDESGKNYAFYLLIVVLIIGAMTPIHEIRRAISKTINQEYMNEASTEDEVLSNNNFAGEVENAIFGKYIMK